MAVWALMFFSLERPEVYKEANQVLGWNARFWWQTWLWGDADIVIQAAKARQTRMRTPPSPLRPNHVTAELPRNTFSSAVRNTMFLRVGCFYGRKDFCLEEY